MRADQLTPVVLLVGEFEEIRSFASRSLRHIHQHLATCKCTAGRYVAVHAERPEEFNSNWDDLPENDIATIRSKLCHLVPLAVADSPNRPRADLQHELHAALVTKDVWGIIACGTAQVTARLINVLASLDLPVLVTVASAQRMSGTWSGPGGTIPDAPRNVLRLIASNDQQAQAIIAKARSLLDPNPHLPVRVLYETAEDLYCQDLVRAIRQQSTLGYPRIATEMMPLSETRDGDRTGGIVYVGYSNGLRLLNGSRDRERWVIISDGCPPDEAKDIVWEKPQDRTNYFLSVPATGPEESAVDAFTAMSTIWRRVAGPSYTGGDGPHPRERMVPFIELVRTLLESDYSYRYKFSGVENQRGGYIINRLA